MLSVMKRGTAQVNNSTWEFHQDSDDPAIFYITPMPQFALDANGQPRIQIVTYQTSDPATNGSGYCQLVVELGVPSGVLPGITAQIQAMSSLFGPVPAPVFQTVVVQPGVIVNLTYPDGTGATTGVQADATEFGSNQAIFQMPLTAGQLGDITTAMSAKGGSPFTVEYVVSVPSFMPAITAELSFNAQTAFDYSVTAVPHTKWAQSTTYTYDITETLSQTNASTVTVTKVDPTVSQDVVDRVKAWGQSVIEARVTEQVDAAMAVQAAASGTQSFSVSDLQSFTESYVENETIQWRVRPQTVLPSFADLGLTAAQIAALQVSVDERKFKLAVLPSVRFEAGASKTSPVPAGKNPFLTDIAAVKQLDVTVSYPTLGAPQTFTFTDNTPQSVETAWQDGGACTVTYTATYENTDGKSPPVQGTMDNVEDGTLTLKLNDIGILNVTFDASGFFAAPSTPATPGAPPSPNIASGKAEVESLTIDLVFDLPDEPPYLQSLVLDAKHFHQTVSSPFRTAVDATYYYTVTYNFKPAAAANPFTTDVVAQTGQWVRINAPVALQWITLMVDMNTSDNSPYLEVDINVYYEETPYLPAIAAAKAIPVPTQSSPVQFRITQPDPPSTTVARRELSIFSNSQAAPLILTATGTADDGTVTTWASALSFSPLAVPALNFFEKQMFTFISFDPSIVDWKLDPSGKGQPGLHNILVQVTNVTVTRTDPVSGATTSTKGWVASSDQSIAWNPVLKGCPTPSVAVTNLGAPYDSIAVDWQASYLYTTGQVVATGKATQTTIALPVAPSVSAPQS